MGHTSGPAYWRSGYHPLLESKPFSVSPAVSKGAVISNNENMYIWNRRSAAIIIHFNQCECAAGSGSFWYQQATRMGYNDREMARIALEAENFVPISGRCAVFAKSDMTHAINDGATQGAVAAGMARALVETILTGVAQNRISGPGTLILAGGVAENSAVLKYLQEHAAKEGRRLVIPPLHRYLGALGAAEAGTPLPRSVLQRPAKKQGGGYHPKNPLPPLDPSKVLYCNSSSDEHTPVGCETVYLGVDCGSVSTKCALLDNSGRYLGGIYLPTSGRPALQVLELIKQIADRYGKALQRSASLPVLPAPADSFQNILGSEYAVDEITCQAEAVKYLFPGEQDLTIFEIGGEDSKFLQLRGGTFRLQYEPCCAAECGPSWRTWPAAGGRCGGRVFAESLCRPTPSTSGIPAPCSPNRHSVSLQPAACPWKLSWPVWPTPQPATTSARRWRGVPWKAN